MAIAAAIAIVITIAIAIGYLYLKGLVTCPLPQRYALSAHYFNISDSSHEPGFGTYGPNHTEPGAVRGTFVTKNADLPFTHGFSCNDGIWVTCERWSTAVSWDQIAIEGQI